MKMRIKKWVVIETRMEMTRQEYLKAGGYSEYMTSDDCSPNRLTIFDTLEEAKKYLEGKTSTIIPYPSNKLVVIEEYIINEYRYDDDSEIDEDDDLVDYADLMGCHYVAPLGEDSRKYTKDIYAEYEESEE